MFLVNVAFVLAFYKELKITSFDPALATTIGINANGMHYLLMVLVAATTIAAFESVGSILVIAMLIVPGAAAHLLTDRLSRMIAVSLVIAALSAFIGHIGAITIPAWFGLQDTSTAGMMAVAAGAIFLCVFLLAPRYGVVSRACNQIYLAMKIKQEDILAFLYRLHELSPEGSSPASAMDVARAVKTGKTAKLMMWDLSRRRLLTQSTDGVALTRQGRDHARNLVRTHRLWETYLCDKMGFCAEGVHYSAHRLEHVTDKLLQDKLVEEAGHPVRDPHRRIIP
jgi:manganese/zinc/iron transport system permease protein